MNRLTILSCFILLLLAQTTHASITASEGYVTPEWLEMHMGDKNLIIVDVSLAPEDYRRGHIPDAVYVDWLLELGRREGKYYRATTKEGFEKVMSRIGATENSFLVFYDNMQNRLAIRSLFVTNFYGHDNAAILEGGIKAWKSAGFEINREKPLIRPSIYRVKGIRAKMMVDKEFVKENLYNKDIIFLDGRPRGMYTGEKPGIMIHTRKEVARRGHLPGALNIPWKSHIDSNSRFLDKRSLQKLYAEQGITREKTRNKTVVVYCNEGVHAVYNWFVMTKILGFKNVRGYGGSMGEWADDPLLPMVTGLEGCTCKR